MQCAPRLVAALALFARETGSLVVAEGIETAAALAAVARLGVDLAQGDHLGRPRSLGTVRDDLVAAV